MRSMMGIILTGGKNNRLKELSDIRSNSAIPVAGKYRAIDFVLSNMVNSGITSVGVLTQYSFRSLMDHIGSGKEWDLDRRNKGVFVFPPFLSSDESGWYKGTADAMYNNITFLERSFEDYVVVAQGNCVYKIDFNKILEFHLEKNSDITIAYREMDNYSMEELTHFGVMEVDKGSRVIDFQEKPKQPKRNTCSMGIYLMKRELLISLLEECISHGNYDFVKDVLAKKIDSLNIYAYKFEGYWRNFSTIISYYRCNMELLNTHLQHKLFEESGAIYTKVKDEPPSKYNDESEVRNSIIADGCIIEGTIENSVIFRGVTVKRGAVIKNSIVMQETVIEEGALLEYMIIDKDVLISSGIQLKGSSSWPVIIGKGARM
jgi:glucose-1-phosphate adenylyltransferase